MRFFRREQNEIGLNTSKLAKMSWQLIITVQLRALVIVKVSAVSMHTNSLLLPSLPPSLPNMTRYFCFKDTYSSSWTEVAVAMN